MWLVANKDILLRIYFIKQSIITNIQVYKGSIIISI